MSQPPRLNRTWRAGQKPNGKTGWEAQEARLPGMQPGGCLQPGSGNGEGATRKGDSTGDLFLISAKTTEAKSIRVERAWLEGIARQARNARKAPALMFGFDSEGAGREDWVAFPAPLAKTLIEMAEAAARGDAEAARALAELIAG